MNFKYEEQCCKKIFYILVISLNILRNYFDDSAMLCSDLYLAKFLDTRAKSSFPCELTCKLTLY